MMMIRRQCNAAGFRFAGGVLVRDLCMSAGNLPEAWHAGVRAEASVFWQAAGQQWTRSTSSRSRPSSSAARHRGGGRPCGRRARGAALASEQPHCLDNRLAPGMLTRKARADDVDCRRRRRSGPRSDGGRRRDSRLAEGVWEAVEDAHVGSRQPPRGLRCRDSRPGPSQAGERATGPDSCAPRHHAASQADL